MDPASFVAAFSLSVGSGGTSVPPPSSLASPPPAVVVEQKPAEVELPFQKLIKPVVEQPPPKKPEKPKNTSKLQPKTPVEQPKLQIQYYQAAQTQPAPMYYPYQYRPQYYYGGNCAGGRCGVR